VAIPIRVALRTVRGGGGANRTYHIDTSIPRDGNDGVERSEIDT